MGLHQGKIWVTSDDEGLLQSYASNLVSTSSSKLKSSSNSYIKYMKILYNSKGKTKGIGQSAALGRLSIGVIPHGKIPAPLPVWRVSPDHEDRENTSPLIVIKETESYKSCHVVVVYYCHSAYS